MPNKTQVINDEDAIKALVSSPEALKIIFNQKKSPKPDQSVISIIKLDEDPQQPSSNPRSRKQSIKKGKKSSGKKKISIFRSQFLPVRDKPLEESQIIIQQGDDPNVSEDLPPVVDPQNN